MMSRRSLTKKDFAWSRWTAEEIERVFQDALEGKRKAYEIIKRIPDGERTFQNTVLPIERADYPHIDYVSYAEFLMHVSSDEKIRAAVKAFYDRFAQETIDLEHDEALYEAVKIVARKKPKLNPADRKLLSDMMRAYKRMGFDLPRAKQNRLRANLKKLSVLETTFQKEIADSDDYILVRPDETEGLPQSYLESLRKDEQGRYIVSLKYPEYFPFIQHSALEHKRKELIDKQLQKGGKKNLRVLTKIIALRVANAKLLGYKNHADFRIEIRMAKTATRAEKFLENLASRLQKKLSKEFVELLAYKRKATGDKKVGLTYYDISSAVSSYFINKLKEEKYSVNEDEIRSYFPLEIVKRGVFDIYARLLSVQFKKLSGYPLWHPDVELYEVRDNDGKILSYILLDLYPREGKYGHAAAFPLVSGRESHMGDGSYVAPVACLVTNFRKPSPKNPSLLSHVEVETFFHEFGHIMHQTLTTAPHGSQSGSSVVRDFVEAPSQMLEHWCWDERVLSTLSGHVRDPKKKLPKALLAGLLKAKDYMVAYDTIRQLSFGIFDLELHRTHIPLSARAICEIYERTFLRITGIAMPPNIFPAGFGHLVGYDAGYYGYLWSKVYASDMFTRFQKEGLLNVRTAKEYRRWILEKGSSMKEEDLVKGFLKRKPSTKAFLNEIGL